MSDDTIKTNENAGQKNDWPYPVYVENEATIRVAASSGHRISFWIKKKIAACGRAELTFLGHAPAWYAIYDVGKLNFDKMRVVCIPRVVKHLTKDGSYKPGVAVLVIPLQDLDKLEDKWAELGNIGGDIESDEGKDLDADLKNDENVQDDNLTS